MSAPENPSIDVVAGVLRNAGGAVLLAQRPEGKAMAGRWEFPGGKLLASEPATDGLARELREELGITVERAKPLIRLHHDYPALSVNLEIFDIEVYAGEPRPLEDQALAWVAVEDLPQWDLLEADRPIMAALRLPEQFLVTPPFADDRKAYLAAAEAALDRGVRFMQCRPATGGGIDMELAQALRALCGRYGVRFIWNGSGDVAKALEADGLHLNAARLMACEERPWPLAGWVGASCHEAAEIAQANRLGLDYIFIGPVRPTASHPGAVGIGWDGFARLTQFSNLPAYAIGGMNVTDIPRAREAGGHGIAAIRGLWRTGAESRVTVDE